MAVPGCCRVACAHGARKTGIAPRVTSKGGRQHELLTYVARKQPYALGLLPCLCTPTRLSLTPCTDSLARHALPHLNPPRPR